MGYGFYDSYKKMIVPPTQQYENDLKALANDNFENAYGVVDIQSIDRDTFLQTDILTRVTKASKTKNIALNCSEDDIRQIIFQDISYQPQLGDMFYFSNYYWIVIDTDNIISPTASCIVRKCNNIIKYKNNNLNFIQSCVIQEIGKNNMKVEEETEILTPDATFLLVVAYNHNTRKLMLNTRFLFGDFAYRVNGIDTVSMIGLIKLKIQLDDIRENLDDFVTGYADNSLLKTDDYSLNIINKDFKAKVGDNPIQLNIELFDNRIKEASQVIDFIYQSDNEKICTIDNNGLVSFIGVGVCNITVKYKKDETVMSNINITVEPAIIPTIDKYSIKIISGSSSMILGSSNSKYTCAVYNNGIEDTNKSITWSLDNIALATIASNPSNRSCVLKANKTTKGIVKLRASLSDNNTIFDEKSITIQSTF